MVTDLLRTVVELLKPVLARIDGHVRAGGMGVVGACDIAIASDAATFAPAPLPLLAGVSRLRAGYLARAS